MKTLDDLQKYIEKYYRRLLSRIDLANIYVGMEGGYIILVDDDGHTRYYLVDDTETDLIKYLDTITDGG